MSHPNIPSQMYDMARWATHVAINTDEASTPFVIQEPVTGFHVVLFSLVLVCSVGEGEVVIEDDGMTPLSGKMTIPDNGQLILAPHPWGHVITAAGSGLSLAFTGGNLAEWDGMATYFLVKDATRVGT